MSASKNLSLLIICLVALVATSKRTAAQELRRYQPTKPTVSPYLNLGRFNDGGLPNYYSLVRPLNRQQQFNQQADRLQRQQSQTLMRLESEVASQRTLVPQVTTGTGSRYFNAGTRAVYRDTLQFYPPVNLRR